MAGSDTVQLRSCACRDCFDITVGDADKLCATCDRAFCRPRDFNCQRADAYGYTEDIRIDMEL